MFTMKSEVVGHLQWVMNFFQVLNKNFVKDGASQFQNFRDETWIPFVNVEIKG
jgi:hypothetical protein